jgi:hypothetical protein
MKKTLLLMMCIALLASCDKWMDINQDPNQAQAEDVTSDLVLPQAELSLAMGYSGILYNHGSFIVQYFDQGVGASNFRPKTRFEVTAGDGDRPYQIIYNQCLVNADYVKEAAEKETQWGNYFAATVLKAFALQAMVDLFGEVPYSEALKGSAIAQPKYDEGSDVYAGILAELDDAFDKLGTATVTDKNLLFGTASTAKWVAFGKALKLKLLMRQASVNWAGVKDRINDLISEGNFPTADVAFTCWVDDGTKRNPWYTDAAIFFGKTDYMAAASYVNTLVAYGDPRLNARYDLPAAAGSTAHKGGIPGYEYITTTDPKTNFSTPKFVATAPAYLITLAEIEFFKAEAAFRNSNSAAAQSAYEAAVRASFVQAGLQGTDADALLTGAYAWDGTANLDKMALQKWIALGCVNGFESWCEVRRLGKPDFCAASADAIYADGTRYEQDKLIYPKGAPAAVAGGMLNRYYYPLLSTNYNSNAPAQKTPATKIFWQP